ncbi:CehA/McbA family metallohydrolase [Knoellia sp. p5-6-4]|uniref:CehA/McbA family metallohydrolase n=1 Tax=unclassified Knoellia TaxID=2618719 RepID=UPI0023DB7BB3|nr:CehA/McbA family metallohydrolase [Knoellia sp. p5-6-4]MDF2145532.1 CehA/McbA family metallohydrolase [Knoellia sp. p5-6-4]
MTRFTGRWTPDHRAESVWHYVSFEVPDRCRGLRLTLDYDRSHGPSGVLDLGLVDPQGWRGWSGGARSVVEVGPSWSTPGYLDRGLPPGHWQVVLGLHRLPDAGLEWSLEVDQVDVGGAPAATAPAPVPPSERRRRRALPATDGLTWLAGDCHAHTHHSDGSLAVDALASLAAGAGLDFLWVTDHNTTSHHPLLADAGRRHGVALLPGQEVTTADGHANAFGDIGWVDFRRPAVEWVAVVQERGGLLSVNHPVSGDCAWRHPLAEPPPLAEVWHWPWTDLADGGPLAWWAAAGRPTPVGGSDWHRPAHGAAPGSPTTWVACADGDVLGGMAAGRTAVSAGRDAPVLLHVGDEWVAVDADGAMLVCPDGRRSPVRGECHTFTGHDGPHLLERSDRGIVSVAA